VWPGPLILGTVARGAVCDGGAEPTVRPGWENGSDDLDSLPQMFPIAQEIRKRMSNTVTRTIAYVPVDNQGANVMLLL